jgi:hypothetical protein
MIYLGILFLAIGLVGFALPAPSLRPSPSLRSSCTLGVPLGLILLLIVGISSMQPKALAIQIDSAGEITVA